MTLKEKFNSIDQSRITADQKAFLDKMKNVTKDFTLENKEVNDKVEGALDKMIASFKEKMPDAIKTSTKVVVPKTAKSKKTTKVVSKTTAPKRTTMSLAKEIRKEGESWKDAQKRASDIIKEDKADVNEVVKTELDKIKKFISGRKELQGISGTDIPRDAVRQAKPRGVRTVTHSGETSNQYGTFNNKLGRRYWESRDRHADRLAPNYPKDAPLLEEGGRVEEVYFFQADNKQIRDDFYEDLQNYMPDHSKTKLGDLSIQIFADKNDALNLTQMANSTDGVIFVEEKFAEGGYLTDPTFGTFQNQVYAYGGGVKSKSTFRTNNSALLEYANFTDGSHINLIKLNRAYKSGHSFAVSVQEFKDEQQVLLFKTLDKAKGKFDSLVSEAKEDKTLRDEGKTNNYELGGDFQSGVYAKGGGFRFKNGRKYDVGSNWTNDHNQFDKGAEHEVQYRKRSKYELGGTMATDLAGHTGGGDGGLNAGMPLDGFSNTGYTGLVGETGAMSSGEMFMNGGGLPAGAEQSYINYYLGEGASQGIYKAGGSIPNNYAERTPKDVWDNWTERQKRHFLVDHKNHAYKYGNLYDSIEQKEELITTSYSDLPRNLRLAISDHVETGQYKAGGMLNANERYVLEIKGLTGLRKEAIENYIAENNLSDNDVLNIVIGLGRKQLKGSDVASAVVGKKGNALSKEVIQFAKDNKGMKLEEGGNIDAFTLRMVKGTAGKPDEAMTEPRSVQFVKGGAVSFQERRNKYLETLGVGESKVWDKIGAESGSEIRNNPKMLKSYAEGVEEMLQKKGVGKGSFDQEDYDFYTDENWHLFNEFLVWNNYYEPNMTKVEKAWRLKYSKDGEKSQYVSDPEVITLNSTKSETDKKYIVNADIESVTVKKSGKEVTYSGKDVLNGANILKDGGGIEDKASYFSKNNVVSVKLKNGQTIKPANGYWVEKDATPIKKMETGGKFEKLSKTVAKNYEGKQVKPEFQKEYGKVYSKEEAKEVGDKVAGKVKASQKMATGGAIERKYNLMSKDDKEELMREKIGIGRTPFSEYEKYSQLSSYHKEMVDKHLSTKKMTTGGQTKKGGQGGIMVLAKKIRKDGESWQDALKRAGQQLK